MADRKIQRNGNGTAEQEGKRPKNGKILRHGTPSVLVADEVVRRTYLGEGFSMPELGRE